MIWLRRAGKLGGVAVLFLWVIEIHRRLDDSRLMIDRLARKLSEVEEKADHPSFLIGDLPEPDIEAMGGVVDSLGRMSQAFGVPIRPLKPDASINITGA